ncbi:YybH family protein [Candidatus Latescibacterota bacterium]
MRAQPRAFLLPFVAFALSACQPATDRTEDDIAAIRALTSAYSAAIEVGDTAALLALRTDDIVQYPPGGQRTRGKKAIEDFYTGLFEHASVTVGWPEEAEEIVVANGWAFQISAFNLTINPKDGGDASVMTGDIIILCERQPDGSWLWAHEIWNFDSPPPGTG